MGEGILVSVVGRKYFIALNGTKIDSGGIKELKFWDLILRILSFVYWDYLRLFGKCVP